MIGETKIRTLLEGMMGCVNIENTLISTIYSLEPVMACITRFSPKKLILLREEDAPEKKLEAERMLIETVGRVMEITTQLTSIYEVVKIAQDTAEVIEAENAQGRMVVVNISGGRKPQALGALFGCYARHKMVERIVYVTEEDGEVVDLPILNFGISKTKSWYEELKKGDTSWRIWPKIGITGHDLQHIRELREIIIDFSATGDIPPGELASSDTTTFILLYLQI